MSKPTATSDNSILPRDKFATINEHNGVLISVSCITLGHLKVLVHNMCVVQEYFPPNQINDSLCKSASLMQHSPLLS